MRTFKEYFRNNLKQVVQLREEKEIEVGSYQTTHHYMCPSAVKFLKKYN